MYILLYIRWQYHSSNELYHYYTEKLFFIKINSIWRLKEPLWKLENDESYLSLPPHVNLKEK